MPYVTVYNDTTSLDLVLTGTVTSYKPTKGTWMDINELGILRSATGSYDASLQPVTGFAANSFTDLGVATKGTVTAPRKAPYFATVNGLVYRAGVLIGTSIPKTTAIGDLDGNVANYVFIPDGQTMATENTTLTGTRIDPRGGYVVFYDGFIIARYTDQSRVYAIGTDTRPRPARVINGFIQVAGGVAYFQVAGWPVCKMSGGQITPASALIPGLRTASMGASNVDPLASTNVYALQIASVQAPLASDFVAGPYFDANGSLIVGTSFAIFDRFSVITNASGLGVSRISPDPYVARLYSSPTYYRIAQYIRAKFEEISYEQWMLGTLLTYEGTGAIFYVDVLGKHLLVPRFTPAMIMVFIAILICLLAVLTAGVYVAYRAIEHHPLGVQ